jgi:hypothetical protein
MQPATTSQSHLGTDPIAGCMHLNVGPENMKKKPITYYLLTVVVLYLSGYGVCRLKGELTHRRTWSGGWNRHWVVSGTPVPRIIPAQLHMPDDIEYNADMDRFKSEFKAISRRRAAWGVLFFPLRCWESLAWWIVNPKDNE